MVLLIGASSAILGAFSPACGGSGTSTSRSTFDAGTPGALADGAAAPNGGGPASGSSSAGDGGADAESDGGSPAPLVRFADWAPDAPAAGLDVCWNAPGDSRWYGPLLGTGVPFPKVGAYTKLPGQMSYNLRVVAAGDSSCASAAGMAIDLPALPPDAHVTIALMGAISASGNEQPAKVLRFTDDTSAPQGEAAVRFIDALTGVMQVVFGTGTHSNFSFSALTGNVGFGASATALADGGAADANGYLLLSPATASALSVGVPSGQSDISTSSSTEFVDGGFVNNPGMNNLFGPGMDVTSASNAAWAAGDVVTIALVDGTGGGGGAQLVQCRDNAPAQGSFSDCAVLTPAGSATGIMAP